MAFSVRFTGYDHAGEPRLNLEPRWWDEEELRKDPRFKVSNDTGSYFDYDLDLSVEEARVIHARYKPRIEDGLYAMPGWRKTIDPQMVAIEAALYANAATFSHFHINVFEWESGL